MNVNFGLFPPLPESGKRLKGAQRGRARKIGLSHRALEDLGPWLKDDSQHDALRLSAPLGNAL